MTTQHTPEESEYCPEWQIEIASIIHDGKATGESHNETTRKVLEVVATQRQQAVAEFAREVEKGLRLASLIDTDEGMVSVKIGMSKIIETVHALAKERGTDL